MAEDPQQQSALSSSPSPGEVSSLNPNLTTRSNPEDHRPKTVDDFVRGIRNRDRVVLSQAITLLESTRADHQEKARSILDHVRPDTGDSIRVAVTGVPGVGKSTFIESLGTRLVEDGHSLAVLTVDPSSERSKGSILGDKTRMGELASRDDVYVRPSPTAGTLGGVARKTRETIFLCEAAGFEVVLVETVGVGQSEVTVRSMVDFFLLLVLAGAGDELQGIKRGIVEMADAIAINKADGSNRSAAEAARSEYENALHLLGEPESGWQPPVLTCSGQTGDGVDEVWAAVQRFQRQMQSSGFFGTQRRQQARHWMYQTIEQRLRDDFFSNPDVQARRGEIEDAVLDGHLSSFAAAEKLLSLYRASHDTDASD
jgi:LAO/AO transport system kinase